MQYLALQRFGPPRCFVFLFVYSGIMKTMPRPKSELTGQTNVNIRMTKEQKQMFKDLGGAEWLRKYLARQLLQEEIQLRQKN